MLTRYIDAAMRKAAYEILAEGNYYGEIPGIEGVYAYAETLEGCRDELQEALEGWIIVGLRSGRSFPVIDGVELISSEESV